MLRFFFAMYCAALIGCAPATLTYSAKARTGSNYLKSSALINNNGSGLDDCNISFDQLKEYSPHCRGAPNIFANGRTCEQYSPSQFTEVVLVNVNVGQIRYACSGIVIDDNWVVTAAHCLLGNYATAQLVNTKGEDFHFVPHGGNRINVIAGNAFFLGAKQRSREVREAFVFSGYKGNTSIPPFKNDVALLRLSYPYRITGGMATAVLAPLGSFNPVATIAGYGYSNADGGSLGKFNLTWPGKLMLNEKGSIYLQGPTGANFCQGDSGGAVFSGRCRGCLSTDAGGEPRPHVLQALISWNATPIPLSGKLDEQVRVCKLAEKGGFQSLTEKPIRDWICSITNSEVEGCR